MDCPLDVLVGCMERANEVSNTLNCLVAFQDTGLQALQSEVDGYKAWLSAGFPTPQPDRLKPGL